MLEAAEDRDGDDGALLSDRAIFRDGGLLADALVRPMGIVEGDVLLEDGEQVFFSLDPDVIQTLPADRPHEPLGDGVELRRSSGGDQVPRSAVLGAILEYGAEV